MTNLLRLFRLLLHLCRYWLGWAEISGLKVLYSGDSAALKVHPAEARTAVLPCTLVEHAVVEEEPLGVGIVIVRIACKHTDAIILHLLGRQLCRKSNTYKYCKSCTI